MYKQIIISIVVAVIISNCSFAKPNPDQGLGIHDQVNKYLLDSNFEHAEEIALKAYEISPKDPETICALACVYRNKARQSLLNVDTDAMGIREGENGTYQIKDSTDLARIFSDQLFIDPETFKKAENLYFKIIEINPQYHDAYFNLLNDYAEMDRTEDYLRVIDLFSLNLREDKDITEYLIDLASKMFQKEDYITAEKVFLKVLGIDSKHSIALSDIAVCRLKQGDLDGSLKYFGKAYAIVPKDAINLQNYSAALIYDENFQEAYEIIDMLKNITNDSSNHFKLGLLALINNKGGSNHFAEYKLWKESENSDYSIDVWYQLATEFEQIDSKEIEDRTLFLEDMLSQLFSGQFDELAILFSNVIERDYLTDLALLYRCGVYDRLNFFDKTDRYLQKVEKRKLKSPQIISDRALDLNYAGNFYAAGKYAEALTHYENVLGSGDGDPMVNYFTAMCFLNLGRIEEAKALFKTNSKIKNQPDMYFINESIRTLRTME